MGTWWQHEIVDAGKLPLMLALIAFVGTFAGTRVVTRTIRAGRGPFGNVSAGGVHIHHVVPGVLLMVAGGFGAIASDGYGAGAVVTALCFGAGAGLVLDEFALVVYLSDVYWTDYGRKSVEAVVLTAALVVLLLLGALPFGADELTPEDRQDRAQFTSAVGFNLLCSLVALLKGKFRMAVVGVLVPFVALVGAVRPARPDSPWAKRLYRRRPRLAARARRLADRHDRRWVTLGRRLADLLGGTPSPPAPAPGPETTPAPAPGPEAAPGPAPGSKPGGEPPSGRGPGSATGPGPASESGVGEGAGRPEPDPFRSPEPEPGEGPDRDPDQGPDAGPGRGL